MTVSQIRDLLKIIADIKGTAIWSTANLNSLIYAEYRDLCNEIVNRWPDYFLTSASVSTVASNDFTNLPSDCITLKKIVDDDGNTLRWVHNSQFDHSETHAEPTKFDRVGSKIWWGTTPDAVYTFTAYYHNQPTDLSSDSDTPSALPPNFHDILAYGAALHSKMAKDENIRELYEQYERRKELLLRQIGMVQTNNARRVLRVYDNSEE